MLMRTVLPLTTDVPPFGSWATPRPGGFGEKVAGRPGSGPRRSDRDDGGGLTGLENVGNGDAGFSGRDEEPDRVPFRNSFGGIGNLAEDDAQRHRLVRAVDLDRTEIRPPDVQPSFGPPLALDERDDHGLGPADLVLDLVPDVEAGHERSGENQDAEQPGPDRPATTRRLL